MTDPKTAARAVASRLSQNDIAIKHVQALDLVAAGCGYQDRSKLTDLAALPVLKKVNVKLLTSAATVLARHDDVRRRTIIDTTTDVLIRTSDAPEAPAGIPRLEAILRLDDGSRTVVFDAAPVLSWFAPDSIIEIIECGWGGDYPVDDVAAHSDEPAVVEALEWAGFKQIGFECHIQPQEGMDWVRANRPDVALDPLPTLMDARLEQAERWYGEYDTGRYNIETSSGWESDTSTDEIVRRIYLSNRRGDTIPANFIVGFVPGAAKVSNAVARMDDGSEFGQALDPDKLHVEEEGETFSFSKADLADPDAFLESDEGKRLIKHIADTSWSAWSRDGTLDQSTCDALARDLIAGAEARAKGVEDVASADTIIGRHITAAHFENNWFEYGDSRWSHIETQIADALANGFEDSETFDRDEWEDAVREAYTDFIVENDTSTASDAISRHDTCEVMFWFIAPESSEDDLIQIDSVSPDATKVEISDEFQFALAKLGWTTSQWRDHTGNKMPSELNGRRPARGTGHAFTGEAGQPDGPLISLDKLVEVIENGCTSYFALVLYAIVPLQDLVKLDLSRPFAFDRAHVALYNPYAGTFMDSPARKGRVIIQHGVDGKLNGLLGDSPASFCGLVSSCYAANLSEPEMDDHMRSATKAVDDALAAVTFVSGHENAVGMKRQYPGHKVHWEYVDDSRTSLKSRYGIGVSNRYGRDYRLIDATYDTKTGSVIISERSSTNAA